MLIRDSEKLANLALGMQDPDIFLIGRMFIAKSVQDLATAIRAWWLIYDEFSIDLPENHNPIWEKAHALVQYVNENPTAGPNSFIEGFKTTPAGMVGDYDITPPSDEARRQRIEWRKQHGLVHVGARHVGIRPSGRVSRFDQRYPTHW